MNRLFKLLPAAAVLFMTVLTTGCWDNRDFQKISIITALGIDLTEDKHVELTIQVLKPGTMKTSLEGGDSSGEKAFAVFSSKGKTVLEAHNNLLLTINREPYYGHLQLIVVGESLEKENIMKYLDFFERYPEMNRQAKMLTARGTKAEKILEAESQMEAIPAAHLRQIVENAEFTGKIKPLSLHELVSFMNLEGRHPVMSTIEFRYTSEKPTISDLHITGSAIMRNDRLVGFIDTIHTRSLLIIRGLAENMIFTIPNPESPGKMLSIDVSDCSVKKTVRIEDGRPAATISVKITGLIGEIQDGGTDLDVEVNKRIEKVFADVVEKDLKNVIDVAQTKLNVDFLGMGELFYKSMPNYWKEVKDDWGNIFPNMQIDIVVEVEIQHTGLISDPSKVR